jgi:hypothetical protein
MEILSPQISLYHTKSVYRGLIKRKINRSMITYCVPRHSSGLISNRSQVLRQLKLTNLRDIWLVNPLNAKLNPIFHLLALLGAHSFLHFSMMRVKANHAPIDTYPTNEADEEAVRTFKRWIPVEFSHRVQFCHDVKKSLHLNQFHHPKKRDRI